jgi:hypothetical protein
MRVIKLCSEDDEAFWALFNVLMNSAAKECASDSDLQISCFQYIILHIALYETLHKKFIIPQSRRKDVRISTRTLQDD